MDNQMLAVVLMYFISKLQAEFLRVCQGDHKDIQCNTGKRIFIESIRQTQIDKTLCNYYTSFKQCNSEDLMKTINKCHGKQQCFIAGKDFVDGICKQYPRKIFLEYSCYYYGKIFSASVNRINIIFGVYGYDHTGHVCSPTSNIGCGWFNSIININVKDYGYLSECENGRLNEIDACLNSELSTSCLLRRTCDSQKLKSFCFYLPHSVDITYRCVKDSAFNSGSSPSESDKQQFNSSIDTVYKRNGTHKNDTKLNNDAMNIKVLLGKENRLLGLDLNNKSTFSLCAYFWNDVAASVACRHLNLSSNGTGGSIPRSDLYRPYKIRVICLGNETSLFDCDYVTDKTIQEACDTVGDATVQCFEHDLKDPTEPLLPMSHKLHIGYVVGIVICCILLVLIVIILVVRFRRYKKISSITSSRELRVNYDTSQGRDNAYTYTEVEEEEETQISGDTSYPVPKQDANSYFVLDPKETGYKRTVGAQQQDLKNPNCSDDQYASSMEGVYDVTNDNRHVNKDDPNIYSHTVDDVYDVTNVNLNIDKDDRNVYSHSVDDTYDVSGNKTKPDAVVDNEYQQFSSRENGYL